MIRTALLLASLVFPFRNEDMTRTIPQNGPPAPPVSLTTQETLAIAAIVAGEASYAVMGREAAVAVAWTIRNRMLTMPLAQVAGYYYGRGEPSASDVMIVEEVFALPADTDPTGGAIYALSDNDRWHNNARDGDIVIVGKCGLKLHLYKDNPFTRD